MWSVAILCLLNETMFLLIEWYHSVFFKFWWVGGERTLDLLLALVFLDVDHVSLFRDAGRVLPLSRGSTSKRSIALPMAGYVFA